MNEEKHVCKDKFCDCCLSEALYMPAGLILELMKKEANSEKAPADLSSHCGG